jgi:hypothetical protein
MNAHADKQNEDKDKAVANNVVKGGQSSPGVARFTDNRPEAIQQKKLQAIANSSPQVKQLKAVQAMADSFTNQHQKTSDKGGALPAQGPTPKNKNKTGLPDDIKSGVEDLSGINMDDVKVHYNSDKPAQLSAHAYAQGTDIHLAAGQQKHLPHEAWHVVQQKQGRVKSTVQLKGIAVNDDTGLEKEADVMGQKTLQPGAAPGRRSLHTKPALAGMPVLQAMRILRNGVPIDIPGEYKLKPGEVDISSHFEHRPGVLVEKASKVIRHDKKGDTYEEDYEDEIDKHPELQKKRRQQGKELAKRIKGNKNLKKELAELKGIVEKLEATAGDSVPKDHADRIDKLIRAGLTGAGYRAIIKGQDELTQSRATTEFFLGVDAGLGSGTTAEQRAFFAMALRAYSAMRTPTETVQAPVEHDGEVTGQQHPTSSDQEKFSGGSSGHSYADRFRVEKQIATFDDVAGDDNASAKTLILTNLLNASVTTLGTMSHPGTAENVPKVNEHREEEQLSERENIKKQAALLESELFGAGAARKKMHPESKLKAWPRSTSPERAHGASWRGDGDDALTPKGRVSRGRAAHDDDDSDTSPKPRRRKPPVDRGAARQAATRPAIVKKDSKEQKKDKPATTGKRVSKRLQRSKPKPKSTEEDEDDSVSSMKVGDDDGPAKITKGKRSRSTRSNTTGAAAAADEEANTGKRRRKGSKPSD